MQDRDGHMGAVLFKNPGHPQLFRNYTGTHWNLRS
jgi:hypothetical protein